MRALMLQPGERAAERLLRAGFLRDGDATKLR